MSSAKLTSKGQITLPKDIRDRLHLRAGHRLEFIVEEDGSVRIVPRTRSVVDLKGSVPPPDKVLSLEDMDKAIAGDGLEP